jgi:ribonuclease-3 family protein
MPLPFPHRLGELIRGVPLDSDPDGEAPVTRRSARSPLVLAYIGDAVYELYVRIHLVEGAGLSRNFQPSASGLVRASTQARILGALEAELSDEELQVVRRGRNASIGQAPKSASMIDYRRATAFECLLGYLLLEGREERLQELLDKAVAIGSQPVSDVTRPETGRESSP